MFKQIMVHYQNRISSAVGYCLCLLSDPIHSLVINSAGKMILLITAVKGYQAVFVIEIDGVWTAALVNRKSLIIAEFIINLSELCRIREGISAVIMVAVDNIDLFTRWLLKISELLSQCVMILNKISAVGYKVAWEQNEITAVILSTLAEKFIDNKTAFVLILFPLDVWTEAFGNNIIIGIRKRMNIMKVRCNRKSAGIIGSICRNAEWRNKD